MSTFAVTKCARRATRIGGQFGRAEKARANRRARRKTHRELRTRGEDGDFTVRRYSGWDVI